LPTQILRLRFSQSLAKPIDSVKGIYRRLIESIGAPIGWEAGWRRLEVFFHYLAKIQPERKSLPPIQSVASETMSEPSYSDERPLEKNATTSSV